MTTEATCTVDGVKTFTCTVCDDSYTEAITAAGHTFDEEGNCACGEKQIEATANEHTEHSYEMGSAKCTACDYVEEGYLLFILNGDGSVGMSIDGSKSVSAFCLRTALEDARVFANNAFLFGITGTPSYVVYMYEDSTENASFEIGADVTINGNGHKIVCAEGVTVTNNGTLNDVEIVETKPACEHPTHGTDGKCSTCGETVKHTYTDGKCTVCGTDDPDYVAPAPTEVVVATLAELQAALADNSNDLPIVVTETITIPAGETVALNLNGKTIIATDNKAANVSYELFYIYGGLTVTGNGTIELTSTSNDTSWAKSSTIFHNRGGVLVIQSGTFTHKGGTAMAYVVDNNANSYGDATTTIKGGNLSSTYVAIRNRMDTYGANGGGNGVATLNIEGGSLSGKRAVWGQVSSAGCKGNITITGGNFSAWEGEPAVRVGTDETGKIVTAIYGGTFSSNVSEYVAEGYVQNENGTVTVAPSEPETPTPAVVLNAQSVAGTLKFEPVTGDSISYVLGRLEVSSTLLPLAGGIKIVEIDVNSDVVETKTATIKYNTVIKGAGSVSGTIVVAEGGTLKVENTVGIDNLTVVDAQGNEMVKGEDGTYEAAPSEPEEKPPVVVPEKVDETVAKVPENSSVTLDQAKPVVEAAVAEMEQNSAISKITENVPENAEFIVELKSVEVDQIDEKVVPTKLVFHVAPMQGENKVQPDAGKSITFRLPVPSSVTKTHAKVYHDKVEMTGLYEIQNENGNKYIEVSSTSFSEFAAEFVDAPVTPAYAAQIGDQKFETLDAALNAAKTMTGDVVVEIYDKVTLNSALSGSFDSIKFVGKDTDAEIYLDVQGYITATGKRVFFEDLKLSKSEGGFVDNAGFMNLAFGIYDVAEITYTDCTFLNGACASFGKVTFNGCTFYRSHDRYGLWAYGAADVVVDGCTFDDIRGIKLFSEGKKQVTDLTVKNTTFTEKVDGKPAIVLTDGKSVTLENNTYSSTGVFELDLGGKPNGTPVTFDVAPTCINDNGTCGVLVDGKIYTTVAQAAEVATSGSKVTLLHESTETVELPAGVELDKNNFAAEGITVKQPAVAEVNGTKYESLQAAIEAANGGEVKVLCDVTEELTSINNVTLTTDVAGGVTITSTYTSYMGVDNVTVGAGVTVASSYIFSSNGTNIIEGALEVATTYYHGYGAKTTVRNGGKIKVNGNTFLRYNSAADAGLYIYGDNDTTTVEYDCDGYISAYSGTFYAKDASVDVGYILLTNTNDGSDYAAIDMELDNTTVNVVGASSTSDRINMSGRVSLTLKNGSKIADVRDMDIAAGTNLSLSVDENSSISVQYPNIAEGVPVEKKDNGDGTFGIQSIKTFVAEVNGVKYETLAAAVAAAASGDTITLLADANETIAFTETTPIEVTIDLNGFTITSAVSTLMVSNGNTVTIKDSVGTGKIISTNAGGEAIAITHNGHVILESGYVYNDYCAVWMYNATENGTFVMNGGTLEVPNGGQTLSIGAGKATINGGKILCNKTPGGSGWNTLIYQNGTLEITGGEFLGTIGNYGKIAIAGGTFSYCDDPNDGFRNEHLADGYATKVNADGSITVYKLPTSLSGSGTQEDPFLINNIDDLKFFRNSVNNGTRYNGQFVKLNADIDLNEEEWTPIGDRNVDQGSFLGTFDGGNHTISNLWISEWNKDGAGFFSKVGLQSENISGTVKNVTFENVTIVSNHSYVGVIAQAPSGALIENVHIVGDVTISGYGYVGGIVGHGYPTINNSSVIADGNITANYWGAGAILGFAGDYGARINNATVEGVKIHSNYGAAASVTGSPYGAAVNGATVSNVEITSNSDEHVGYVAGGGQLSNVSISNVTATVNGQPITPVDAVATVNGEIYFTLQAAIDAANAGDTVTLLADVELTATATIDKAITLDLNGHVISGTKTAAAYSSLIHVANTGALTVKNSTGEGKISYAAGVGGAEGAVIWNEGDLVLESGTLETTGTWSIGYAVDVRPNAWGSAFTNKDVTFVMNGGKIKTSDAAIRVANNCSDGYADITVSFTMNGGEINSAATGIFIQQLTSIYDDLKVIIKGGAITASTAPIRFQGEAAPTSYRNGTNGSALTIEGGNIAAGTGGSNYIWAVNGMVRVSGKANVADQLADADITVSKTFAQSNNVLADGYKWAEKDGAYVLTACDYVAQIGTDGAKFESLAEAMNAAQTGDTVTLLADVSLSSILTIDKAITLDGNGKTLTSTAGRAINVETDSAVEIKNLTIAADERAINIINKPAKVTVDNVTATASNNAIMIATSAGAVNLSVNNSNLTGLAVVNVSGAAAQVEIKNTTLTNKDANDKETYGAITVWSTAAGAKVTVSGGNINVEDDSKKAFVFPADATVEGVADVAYIVVTVGDGGFLNLKEAIDYAKAGETITLIRDVTISSKLTIDKSITIDGNGKKLTYTGTDRAIDVPKTAVDADVSIKNLTVNFTGGYSERGINYNTNGKLTLDKVTVNGTNVTYAVNMPGSSNGATVEIKNSDLSGCIALNVWGKDATVNVTDTNLTSIDKQTVENYAAVKLNSDGTTSAEGTEITVTGGSITALDENNNPSSAVTNATATGKINISSTTVVNGNINECVAVVLYDGATQFYGCFSLQNAIDKATNDPKATVKLLKDITENVTMSGAVVLDVNNKTLNGTITLTDAAAALTAPEGLNVTTNVADRKVVYENGTYKIVEKVYVAQIGEAKFESLQEAIDAANAGDTVTLLTDIALDATVKIPAGKTITLELNGKTVSMVKDATVAAHNYMITNLGNLTIQDSVGGGKLSYEYVGADLAMTYAANTITSEPGSVLTVKSGTIENLTYDKAVIAYAIDGRTNGSAGDVTINIEGGNITSKRQAVRIFANSTTNTGALNISGGEFTGRVIIQNASEKANKAALNITGGTFNANAYKTDVLYVGGSNSATIAINAAVNGGTFNGEITDTNVAGFISGGTYSIRPAAELLADGYEVVVSDGVYGVAKKAVVSGEARIGETLYATLADAINAANAAATAQNINILKNIDVKPAVTINAPMNIVTNGYALWNSAGVSALAEIVDTNSFDITDVMNLGMVFAITAKPQAAAPVAKIGETTYTTVEAALRAAQPGDTVVMVANSDESGVYLNVSGGIKLDLAGHTLTAAGLTAFQGADVYDSTVNTNKNAKLARLVVPKDNLVLQPSNSEVSFWDTTKNNYVFLTPSTNGSSYQYLSNVTAESFVYTFRPGFGYLDGQITNSTFMADGGFDNGITIKAQVSWMSTAGDGTVISQTYAFTDELVATYYTKGALTLTMTGIEEIDTIKVKALVVSDAGVVFEGVELTYNSPNN